MRWSASAFDCCTFARAASACCVATCFSVIAFTNASAKSRSLMRKSVTLIPYCSSWLSRMRSTSARIFSRFGATSIVEYLTVSALNTWATRGATIES
jgi:hypothetical protein